MDTENWQFAEKLLEIIYIIIGVHCSRKGADTKIKLNKIKNIY